jgi:hypothetical protein
MKYKQAISILIEFLQSDFITSHCGSSEIREPFTEDVPLISIKNVDLPKDGIGHKSGIYFIYSSRGEIYYIGKATANNLHEEVWGKLKTPSLNKDNTRYYPKNYFLSRNLDKKAINDVTNGNVKIGVLVISNEKVSSLAEVFLQTAYAQNNSGLLPKLNSRIG